MAIEIFPKTRIKKPQWAVVLLAFSLVLLLVLASTYFYFVRASGKTEEEIEKKKQVLAGQEELEEELLLTERKINSFRELLSQHRDIVNVFEFLEAVCHPKVQFENFDLDVSQRSVAVSGRAQSFISLGQQLLILKGEDVLKDVILSDISLSEEGGVSFNLALVFNYEIFNP